MATIFQISSTGIRLDAAPDTVAALQREFIERHALVFQNALAQEFFAKLQSLLSNSRFAIRQTPKVGEQEIESPAIAGHALSFVLGNKFLMNWINQVTACTVSRHVLGGIARLQAVSGQQLDWHDDRLDTPVRQLAMTINLSSIAYAGGDFELRRKGHQDILFRHHHGEPGSIVLFRVDQQIEHRVTPVVTGGPRLVYAGWFT